ncbi:hypothetical protein GN244_ATG13176 [Phytophthora infestans]|uniref:RxLR effector protein n=1 Tax=Phytophthora infestans TaxID=4787 RepID=A0A833SXY0_PHYIN|nr:hypothetical protein GN244_ATG13176 [Phytophthora infestans]KAF4149626.1 hypothetical protein GN958_ATG01210 [Phytophthora infestans]
MNRAFYLGLVAVMAVANAIEFVAAEHAALIDADDLTDSERIADARHLRGIQKTDDEERVGVPAAAWYATHVMRRPSSSELSNQNSQKIFDAEKDDRPLPKWAKALIILAGLGVVSGAAVSGVKISQAQLDLK